MSLSLAKRSLRSFDIADAQTGHQKKVFGHVKGQKKTGSTKTMKHSSQDEKIKKLLLLTTTSIDDKVSRRVSRRRSRRWSCVDNFNYSFLERRPIRKHQRWGSQTDLVTLMMRQSLSNQRSPFLQKKISRISKKSWKSKTFNKNFYFLPKLC